MHCFPRNTVTRRKLRGVVTEVYEVMRIVDKVSCYSSIPTVLELVGHSLKTDQFKADKSKAFFMQSVVTFWNFSLRQNTGLDGFSFGQSPPLPCCLNKMKVTEGTVWLCPFSTNSAARELLNLAGWASKVEQWLLQCGNFPTLSMRLRQLVSSAGLAACSPAAVLGGGVACPLSVIWTKEQG